MKEERNCRCCGKVFIFKRHGIARSKGLFCSVACANDRGSLQERFNQRIGPKEENGCILWVGAITDTGYGYLGNDKAHRISYELFYGPFDKNLFVCHKCDTPLCVNPEHLFLGTSKDNVVDMVLKGRACDGEKSGTAKFTNEQVLEIRNKFALGNVSLRALGREYGVAHETIRSIVYRKSWTHI